jgi:hypothetical protein
MAFFVGFLYVILAFNNIINMTTIEEYRAVSMLLKN